jgi:hypothetical protein
MSILINLSFILPIFNSILNTFLETQLFHCLPTFGPGQTCLIEKTEGGETTAAKNPFELHLGGVSP